MQMTETDGSDRCVMFGSINEPVASIDRRVPVPPGARAGLVEWEGYSMLLLAGMPVAETMHAFYWRELATFTGMLIEAKRLGVTVQKYMLVDCVSNKAVGGSYLDPRDGPHDFAWLSCLFAESFNYRMLFALQSETRVEFDLTNIKGGRFYHQ